MALTPGSVFAGYLIEHRLGLGGMGAVYAARHPRLPRRVALKVLVESLGSDPGYRARFEREAELAARVDHPNLVSVYDRGVEGEQLWIAMQYVDGVDVDQLVKRGPSVLTPSRAVFIIGEAAKGLDSAHRRGLLHRDVKPANILVAEDPDEGDHVLVTDFGIARALDQTTALTETGSAVSTLPFASPEQIEGRELDHRSDIYSLGCTLYVMLTGSVPFPRDSQVAIIAAHLTEPPPRPTLLNPSLPAEMDQVIARAMAKDPAQRYQSCRQFASAAHAALSGSGGLGWATVPTGPYRGAASPQHSNPSIPPVAQPDSLVRSDPPVTPAGAAETVVPAGSQETVILGARPQGPPPIGQIPPIPLSPAAFAPAPSAPRKKRGLIVAGVVAAVVIVVAGVAGFLAFGNKETNKTTPAVPSRGSPAESHAPAVGPWRAYDFEAKALPGLMPDTPSGTAYQGATCKAVNARFEPIDDLETKVEIARVSCVTSAFEYDMICNRDRTPRSLAGFGDRLTAVHDEPWSRGNGSGRVVYGTSPKGYGALAVSFDSAARNFCEVWAFGKGGSTGQDVYNGWFRDAPL